MKTLLKVIGFALWIISIIYLFKDNLVILGTIVFVSILVRLLSIVPVTPKKRAKAITLNEIINYEIMEDNDER